MQTQEELRALTESILLTSKTWLGSEEKLQSLGVELFSAEMRAVVWANLRDGSVDAQIDALKAFEEVRECYADELGIELHFGEFDFMNSRRSVAVESLQFAR